MGRVGWRGPRGKGRQERTCQGLAGRGGGYPHLAFSPAGLGLGPASGSHCLSHRPYGVTVAVCFCQSPALPTTCPVPPSGLSHDRICAAPGGEVATWSLYGLQRRTNLFTKRRCPPPLPFRPRPLIGFAGLVGSAGRDDSTRLYRPGQRRCRLTGRIGFPGSAELHSVCTLGALAHLPTLV